MLLEVDKRILEVDKRVYKCKNYNYYNTNRQFTKALFEENV